MNFEELTTKEDLQKLKADILQELKPILLQRKDLPEYLRSKDIMKKLSISKSTLHDYRQSGKLKFRKIGNEFFYTRDAVEEMFEA